MVSTAGLWLPLWPLTNWMAAPTVTDPTGPPPPPPPPPPTPPPPPPPPPPRPPPRPPPPDPDGIHGRVVACVVATHELDGGAYCDRPYRAPPPSPTPTPPPAPAAPAAARASPVAVATAAHEGRERDQAECCIA